MINIIKSLLLLTVVTILISSCTSQKKIIYFQDRHHEQSSGNTINNQGMPPHLPMKIYKGDILTVQFFIDNPEAIPGIGSTLDQRVADNRTYYEKGFIVGPDGYLELPLVGKIMLENLTISEARDAINKAYKEYITTPVVVLKKLSFKISIMGEVNKPGLYNVANENITLPEALAMAGDLTNYGSRTDIKIFRKANGGLQELNIDLTTRDYLQPSMNYLMQDDVVYVRPLRRKALANIQPALNVVSTIVSSAVLVATFLILRAK